MSLIPVDKFESSIILRGPNKPFSKVLPLPKILRLPADPAASASRVCAMTEKKKVWYSKTSIFGALQLAAGTLALFAGSDLIQQHPQAVAAIAAASGAITIGLRLITSLPIEW